MTAGILRGSDSLPSIVYIVIVQATHRLAERTLTRPAFDQQIQRITREELGPRGLTLLVRNLPGERLRFLIKEQSSGSVREMMDFNSEGILDRGASGALISAAGER